MRLTARTAVGAADRPPHGDTVITATATQDLPSCHLDLVLTATSVVVNGTPARFRQVPQELAVTPAAPLRKGAAITVEVRYAGTPSTVSDGRVSPWLSTPDGAQGAEQRAAPRPSGLRRTGHLGLVREPPHDVLPRRADFVPVPEVIDWEASQWGPYPVESVGSIAADVDFGFALEADAPGLHPGVLAQLVQRLRPGPRAGAPVVRRLGQSRAGATSGSTRGSRPSPSGGGPRPTGGERPGPAGLLRRADRLRLVVLASRAANSPRPPAPVGPWRCRPCATGSATRRSSS